MVGSRLDEIRAEYLKYFLSIVADLRETGQELMLEGAFRDPNGALVCEGKLGLPLRGDVFVVEKGIAQGKRIEFENSVCFAPLLFDWEATLKVNLGPFRWEACTLVLPEFSTRTWDPLIEWFSAWFDSEDAKPRNEFALGEVVHFLGDPRNVGGNVEFEVDFGSAPVEAFEGLLDAFKKLGVRRVQIGNVHS